jgi:hypothetical protein
MTDFSNINDNPQFYSPDVSILIDEVSSTEYYIGTSNGFKDGSVASWSIKKIWQDGTVWKTQFPDGDQSFKFIWNGRSGYTYQ